MKATAKLLTDFATQAREAGAQYGIAHVHVDFNPESSEGPYTIFYRLPGALCFDKTVAQDTPEDAVECLLDALHTACQSNAIFSYN